MFIKKSGHRYNFIYIKDDKQILKTFLSKQIMFNYLDKNALWEDVIFLSLDNIIFDSKKEINRQMFIDNGIYIIDDNIKKQKRRSVNNKSRKKIKKLEDDFFID